MKNFNVMLAGLILLPFILMSGCTVHVGADIGVTRTAEESSTETVKTIKTSNPERIKDEATTD